MVLCSGSTHYLIEQSAFLKLFDAQVVSVDGGVEISYGVSVVIMS